MSDTEEILLPRSGVPVVLLRDEEDDSWDVKLLESREYLAYHRDRDEAIRRADAEAQALLGQLLPADARERIAQAVADSLRLVQTQAPCACPDDEARPYAAQCGPCRQGPQFVADAVLRAPRGGVKPCASHTYASVSRASSVTRGSASATSRR